MSITIPSTIDSRIEIQSSDSLSESNFLFYLWVECISSPQVMYILLCSTSDTRVCALQYRCLQSNICLPQHLVCDGVRHCPLGDDERLCHFRYHVKIMSKFVNLKYYWLRDIILRVEKVRITGR